MVFAMVPPASAENRNKPALRTSLVAGFSYFVLVFAAGFCLGVLREWWLIPAFGRWTGSLAELPLILAAAWWICGRTIRHFAVPPDFRARLAMGVSALLLLLAAEFALAAGLFGQSPAFYADQLMQPLGLIGLAGQVAFGLFPLFRYR